MAINKTACWTNVIRILAFTTVGIILLILSAACSNVPQKESDLATTEGYDFSYSLDETEPGAGPKVGEKVDVSGLKTNNGIKFSSIADHGLIMLVTVDPNCGACKTASDEIRDVQRRIQQLGISYYLVSFTSPNPRSEFFQYTDSFRTDTSAFLWDMSEMKPPESLHTMVLPSHILVDSNGVVIRKWLGTDIHKPVRRRMANQIVADAFTELSYRANHP